MADRLKQIWGGFADRTGTRLTSVDISHISRPGAEHRAARRKPAEEAFDAGHEDRSEAVSAALQALHADLENKARGSRRRRRGAPEASFGAEDIAPPPSGLEERLLADIKFTEARVKRGPSDYLAFAAERQAEWKKRKRKKFLGLF